MRDDDSYLSRLQVTIASLRYWVPAISDAASVEETEANGVWQLAVRPRIERACRFTLKLSRDRRYGLIIDGVDYLNRRVETLDIFPLLAEAITQGHVVQRRWSSPNTGVETEVEAIVDLGNGTVWRDISGQPASSGVAAAVDGIRRDQHFLPYRRQ